MQCTICSRNNHSIENCRFKNNPINCQLCGIIGHSAQTCRKFSIQKKLINRLNSFSDTHCYPSPSVKKSATTYKINHISEPLFIRAKLDNIDVPITIDTGANICCIRHTLVPPENKIIKENIILSGPNNNPLTVYGSTIIKLKIDSHNFQF